MLVEVNRNGKTHEEQAASVSQPCTDHDRISKGLLEGYCLNCGWRPAHVQERGAEVVVHLNWETRNLEWYDKHLRLMTPQGRLLSGE